MLTDIFAVGNPVYSAYLERKQLFHSWIRLINSPLVKSEKERAKLKAQLKSLVKSWS